MATADELLTAPDPSEEILIVNPSARVITIPATITNLGVESDDDVKRLYFKVPRYYGEFDLSSFNIRINFRNANGNGDLYIVEDMETTDDDYITFSWLIDRVAFNKSGNVEFSICMKLLDGTGLTVKEWNTTYATLPVLKGLETEQAMVDEYPTIFNTLLCRLYAIEAATGNGQHGYYNVIRVDDIDRGARFTIVDQDGETVATVYDGTTLTPSYDEQTGYLSWTSNDGTTVPEPMNIRGPKGDKGEQGAPGKDGKVSPVIYSDSPYTVYDYARNKTHKTFRKNGTSESDDDYTQLIPCPRYLGWRIENDARLVLYIGKVNDSGSFERKTKYDIYLPSTDNGIINYLNPAHSRMIEIEESDLVFYYRFASGKEDDFTIIGGDTLPSEELDAIGIIPNSVRYDSDSKKYVKSMSENFYGVVLPADSYYMILHDRGTETYKNTTTNIISNMLVSYEGPTGTINTLKGASFGYIPTNVGVAQLTVPKECRLEDLTICTSKPVRSNNNNGHQRIMKEIGRNAIKTFDFVGKSDILWNDSTERSMLNRQFYGVPYSSRWINSHYIGFEVSPETAINALNDPYSIAYDGGITSYDSSSNAVRNESVSGTTEIGSRGGPGYGLVCSAFTMLMNGNPYPQTNRGFTFDKNFAIEKTPEINAGMALINDRLSHVVVVDETYDSGYSLYEATDPCVAKTIHTATVPTYAKPQTRIDYLDNYIYRVKNLDTTGYETNLTNFDVSPTTCAVRPWRGHKCVYGPWDKSSEGSGIGITADTNTTGATLTINSTNVTEQLTIPSNKNYLDIAHYVTANGEYTLTDANGNANKFRYFDHDDVVLNFDKYGNAYFSHDDVEYVYVTVKGYGGEFANASSKLDLEAVEPIVIAAGKNYPDLAEDPSIIKSVRAAIVSDPTPNDCWGKYSVPATFGKSEYVDETYETKRTKADAIVCEVEGHVIDIDDSSDDYLRGLKLFGKSTQKTTIGKNMLTTQGQLQNVYNEQVLVDFGEDVTFDAVTFSMQVENLSLGNTGASLLSYKKSDGTFTYVGASSCYCNGIKMTEVNTTYNGTVTATNTNVTFRQLLLYLAVGAYSQPSAGAVVKNQQLEVGTVATSYEPYTGGKASPNPSYPQEIVNVDNPVVSIYKKNLFNINAITTGYGIVNNGDGSITCSANTSQPTKTVKEICPMLKPGDVATFSFNSPAFDAAYNKPTKFIYITGAKVRWDSGTSKTITQDILDGYIYFYPSKNAENQAIPTTISDIQIEYGTVATEYEPYENPDSIYVPRIIRGIPVHRDGNYTDETGQQWICDEVDFERGVYVQRVREVVYTGEENWAESGAYPAYSVLLPEHSITGLCSHTNRLTVTELTQGTNGVYLEWSAYAIVQLKDEFPTLSEFKTFLAEQYAEGNPFKIVYAFEHPIETNLTTSELAMFKTSHSNYHNTTVFNNYRTWMKVKYNADTKQYINNSSPQVSSEDVQSAVTEYMEENPVTAGITEADLYNGVTMLDRVTGKRYILCVSNGELSIIESGG